MKVLSYLKSQLKYFFVNPFWTKIAVLAMVFVSLLFNGIIWYWYFFSLKGFVNLTPIGYVTGILGLNIFLADIIYPKQSLISYILLATVLFIQIFFLFFLKLGVS